MGAILDIMFGSDPIMNLDLDFESLIAIYLVCNPYIDLIFG